MNMARLLAFFLLLPLFDLVLLVQLRHTLGTSTVFVAVLVSALLGMAIARATGARELRAWQSALLSGQPTDGSTLDSVLIWLGCLGLMVPGFVSDVLGGLLLLGPVRRRVAAQLTERVQHAMQQGNLYVRMDDRSVVYHQASYQTPGHQHPAWFGEQEVQGDVIDAEGETVAESAMGGSSHKLGRSL